MDEMQPPLSTRFMYYEKLLLVAKFIVVSVKYQHKHGRTLAPAESGQAWVGFIGRLHYQYLGGPNVFDRRNHLH